MRYVDRYGMDAANRTYRSETFFDFVSSFSLHAFITFGAASNPGVGWMLLRGWLGTMATTRHNEDEVWTRALTEMQRQLGKR